MYRPSIFPVVATVFIATAMQFCVQSAAQESSAIPPEFQRNMKRMVGTWTFTGTEEEEPISGEEVIRLVNNETGLLQEGFFDLGGGKKEHYVILSGWDGEKKRMLVKGFTSGGVSWNGEWVSLKKNAWVGTTSGRTARFIVGDEMMRYEEGLNGKDWISRFERKHDKHREGK